MKRPHKKKVKRDWKKLKLTLPDTTKLPTSLPAYSASDVFEANPLQPKKILFKLPDAVPETAEDTQLPVSATNVDTGEVDCLLCACNLEESIIAIFLRIELILFLLLSQCFG